MRDIVWAIDPRSDDLSHVVIRIQQFATDVLESKNIEWDFHTPREMEKIKLDSEQRRHLFLIFKEAITNASSHANPRTILLSITFTRNQLIAEIRDDGRGFNGSPADSTSLRGGHGLENMQRRASELGGRIKIDSLVGKGTRVELTVPLKKIA